MKFSGRNRILAGMTLIFLCLGLTVIPVHADSAPMVITFELQGNTHVPAEKILGVITNTKMGSSFDARLAQNDVQAIMGLGYFSDVQVKTENMLNGVKVIFEVFENPIFNDVQISGLTDVKPEELKPFFSQKAGEVFNTATFRTDLGKAIKFCQEKKGLWIQPKNSQDFGITAAGIVKVELVELKYGKIKISGLVKTQEKVVTRELTFKTGDIIRRDVLQDNMARLMRLRIFDNIEPQLAMSETPDSLDLVLDFKEAQTGTFSFGVSYSETTQTWGGLLGFSEANLMGSGQSLGLNLDFSVDNTEDREVSFTFNDPWLTDKHTSFGLSVYNSNSVMTSTMNNWGITKQTITSAISSTDYDPTDLTHYYDEEIERTGFGLSLGQQLARDLNGSLQLNFEKNQLKGWWDKDTDSSDETSGNSYKLPDDPDFWDNSLGLNLVHNKLLYADSNFVNGGYYLSANDSVHTQYLGGAYDYNKLVLESRWFKPLANNFVFGTRLQGTWLSGDFPDYDALYLGGMYRLRGYNDRRYEDDSTKKLVGSLTGDSYLLSNTEFRYRIPNNKNFELVAFYDVGRMSSTATVKSDFGLGFRISVPMLGLIRLDQAWNIDGDKRLVFSLGELF
ncbi:MAG TPA: hypothetical protein DDW50_09280 [Firmicutes bacterium]|nr:hypothetical protein [Bacillota bacterium]